jgi:hypothetical protein
VVLLNAPFTHHHPPRLCGQNFTAFKGSIALRGQKYATSTDRAHNRTFLTPFDQFS